MLDKIKQKLHHSSSSDSPSEPQHQQTHHTSTPSINEPSSESASSTTPSSRHQSHGSVDSTTGASEARGTPNRISISVPNDTQSHANARGRRTSLAADNVNGAQRSAASRSRSRARDVLWKNSLFDESRQGEGSAVRSSSAVRAKSLSVAAPHPTMAEEEMARMPYGDWSRGRK